MLTMPITTPHFHASILSLLTTYSQAHLDGSTPSKHHPMPLVPPLKPVDTSLTPSDSISQLIAFTSPWIDLTSPDPLIAHLSRQVFNQEIAYAAFCGVVTVIVQGPRLHHGPMHAKGTSQYARAIQEALSLGNYLQLHILMPMIDNLELENDEDMGNLARFAREEYIKGHSENQEVKADLFGTWDAWNVIRSVCKYSSRLSVGKDQYSLIYNSVSLLLFIVILYSPGAFLGKRVSVRKALVNTSNLSS